MQLTFYGGAGGVTGSKHLLETAQEKLLFDCGTFQGLPDVRERNRSFPFPPDEVNHVVLSHAHIDHCGMLPLLVRRGFVGSVYATPATKQVARAMLLDAASIEEQDAIYRRKYHLGAPDEREPLFTPDDIPAVLERFVEVPYARVSKDWYTISDTVRLKFYDAGHILGSAISVLELRDGAHLRYLAYSGDVGPPATPLLHDPEVPEETVDTVLLESTYGARQHKPIDQALVTFAETIKQAVARQGKIIIPAFSLGRTQWLVYLLHKLTDEEKIPRIPIFVDSPLALDLTEVFRQYEAEFDDETRQDFAGDAHSPLSFSNLTYVQTKRDSQQLNVRPGPFIVISASGMMTAGRIVHHLRHSVSDPHNVVIITGYQAHGTLGRRLLEGAERVELHGDVFKVAAQIATFNELSAHADMVQLETFLKRWRGIERIFLVHGEPEQADRFAATLQRAQPAWTVSRPNEGDTVTL